MFLKLIGAMLLCLGCWYAGKCYSQNYNERIRLIDEYISFTLSLKSAIGFSGMTLRSFFERNMGKYTQRFSEICLKEDDILNNIKCFEPINKEEAECVQIVTDFLEIAEHSSDIQIIMDIADEAVSHLTLYKKQITEEYCGKIKISPEIGLLVGVFVAVLVL